MKKHLTLETMLKNIVAFCALMENGKGIIDKSPDYILEKFLRYCLSDRPEWQWGLDNIRSKIVKKWTKKWLEGK